MRDGADTLGVAGGDGSLAVVAAAALAHRLPFVCVPAGTRNHFALDIGIDRSDLVGSLDAFTDGVERRVDVAEVNARLFLNNVSLGVYGDAVRQPAYRDAKGRTLAQTAAHVLGPGAPAPAWSSWTTAAAHIETRRSCSCRTTRTRSNRRVRSVPAPTLDTGLLGVLVLERPARGKTPARAWTAKELEVTATAPVHAGIDGEPVEVVPPLRFVVRPRALCVRLRRP